jgi:hypothetical protein
MQMPGKRTPADPGDMNVTPPDMNRQQAGIQRPDINRVGAQWEHGEAPTENAYREIPHKKPQ